MRKVAVIALVTLGAGLLGSLAPAIAGHRPSPYRPSPTYHPWTRAAASYSTNQKILNHGGTIKLHVPWRRPRSWK